MCKHLFTCVNTCLPCAPTCDKFAHAKVFPYDAKGARAHSLEKLTKSNKIAVNNNEALTDSAEADSAETDSAETDSAEMDSAETDSAETDSAETDSAETVE